MPLLTKLLSRFRNLSVHRKIIISISLLILILAQIFTILTVIGISNLSLIVSNVKFPSGHTTLNTDIYNPQDMLLELPYEIPNPTIFEISDISATVNITLEYVRQSDQVNISSMIFTKTRVLGNSKPLNELVGVFIGDFNDFNISALSDFYNDFDPFQLVYFYLDVKISIKYYLKLIDFSFYANNILLY